MSHDLQTELETSVNEESASEWCQTELISDASVIAPQIRTHSQEILQSAEELSLNTRASHDQQVTT